jgi:hypothetical protein
MKDWEIKEDVSPILFYFISGAIDVFVTMIVIFNGWGYEATETYNWVQPVWLMFVFMITANLVFCLIPILPYKYMYQKRHRIESQICLIVSNVFMYSGGLARLIVGAGSGLLIIASVVKPL